MPPAFGTGQAEFRAGGMRKPFPVHRQTPDAPLRPVRSSTGDPAAAHEPPQMPNSSRLSGSNLPQTSRPAAVALQGRRPPRRRPTATPVVRVAQVWDSRHDRSVRPAASLPVWPVAALQPSSPDGCEGCDGCDENRMPRSACSLLGARYIADALPAFEPRVIGTAFAYALTNTGGVSFKGPPHPFPPKTPVLS